MRYIISFLVVAFLVLIFIFVKAENLPEKAIPPSTTSNLPQSTVVEKNVPLIPIDQTKKLLTKSIAQPDTIFTISDQKFIGVVTQAPRAEQGLYLVDLISKKVERLIGGLPTIKEIKTGVDEQSFILISSTHLRKGIQVTDFQVILLSPKGSFSVSPLTHLTNDAESGGCGNKNRIKETGIQKASTIAKYVFSDQNKDGIPDISFNVTVTNCNTLVSSNQVENFLYKNDQFEKILDNSPQSNIDRFKMIDQLNQVISNLDGTLINTSPDTVLISLDDFLGSSLLDNRKVIQKRFIEISECSNDSVFEIEYDNNLVAAIDIGTYFYLFEGTPTYPNGIGIGSTREDIKKIVGTPAKEYKEAFIYLALDRPAFEMDGEKISYEAVTIFFKNDKVYAIFIYETGLC